MKLLHPNNYKFNQASLVQIKNHLWRTSKDYTPPLDTYVDVDVYAKKLYESAFRLEFFDQEELIGLLAYYYNPENKSLFITNISIERKYRGEGFELILGLVTYAKISNLHVTSNIFSQIRDRAVELIHQKENDSSIIIQSLHTEVREDNQSLIQLYKTIGFEEIKKENRAVYFIFDL